MRCLYLVSRMPQNAEKHYSPSSCSAFLSQKTAIRYITGYGDFDSVPLQAIALAARKKAPNRTECVRFGAFCGRDGGKSGRGHDCSSPLEDSVISQRSFPVNRFLPAICCSYTFPLCPTDPSCTVLRIPDSWPQNTWI